MLSTEPLKLLKPDLSDQMWHVNVMSALMICKGLRKPANHKANASVVLLSSVAGLRGNAGQIVYSATKSALIGATRSLAMELIRDKIRVNAVAPALVETRMASGILGATGSAAYNDVLRDHPLGVGKPGDVAPFVCFLLSDGARWMTGATYPVDGGYSAGRL